MAYEIPQQLEYKEKIIFNLTFKQLGYAFLFGTIALLIFFKLPLNIYIRGILSGYCSLIGALFMFFNFDKFLKEFINWYRNKKISGEKFRNFKNIKEIKDNLINNNIAILKVEPINFKIKPEKEQKAITETFQKFINSLEFPIQILINTTTLNLKKYLSLLKKRINKTYQKLFKSYKKHLKKTIANNSVMNRNFYIVIKNADNIKINIIGDRLDNLNLKYKRLNDKELKKLTNKFFESNYLLNEKNYIEDNKYNRVISAYGYPRTVEIGFLDKIVSCAGDFDISLFIEPYPIETMLVNLNRELQKQRADLYSAKLKGILNPSLEIKYADTRKILEELQKGQEKLFNISLYIKCKAESLEELNLLTKKVESELNSIMIIPKIPYFRMLQGYKSTSPLAENLLNINRNITTSGLSAFFPFTSPFLQVDNTGIWMGLNKNNIPIIRDIFKLTNPNGCVLATSGSGKSYFTKLLISRYLLNNVKVIVIDPQGEYRNLVNVFNGQRIDLSRNSKTMINPLDLMGHDYTEKRLALMDLMPIILGELTEPQKSFIDRAITKAYTQKGITEDPESWNNKPPILGDVLNVLKSLEKEAITLEKTTIRSLINRLTMYVDGVFSFLNKHTNINFDNNFVCFDIGNMPKQVKPVIMFLVLDYVYMKMKDDLERKLLVIDEAWSLLGRTEEASYIFEIVKTCRKFNMGLLLINQEVEGLLSSDAGKSVLANSAYTLLMRQKPAVIDSVQNTFHLSKQERITLLTAGIGEGILIIDDDHSELKVLASNEEHKLITTNPDEIIEQSKTKKSSKIKNQCTTKDSVKFKCKSSPKRLQPEVSINVDEYRRFYRHKDLNLDEIKYLLTKKYQIVEKHSIVSEKKEKFLLRPRFNESINHLFLTYDIAEFLEKKGIKVSKFITKKPDIVFELNKKKIAIEVETGKRYRSARKELVKKAKRLNENYDYWFFVVTTKNDVSKYRKLGKTIDPRCLSNHLNKLVKVPKICPVKNSSKRKISLREGGQK